MKGRRSTYLHPRVNPRSPRVVVPALVVSALVAATGACAYVALVWGAL